ncbi:fibronectin type III domain-containing protein, partial [Clostridium sp.]|uniref:fibronectin type III domain-containing protein n=1 Tax=Clostridium sp. TaxID=1506 RepID=UPI003F35B2AB
MKNVKRLVATALILSIGLTTLIKGDLTYAISELNGGPISKIVTTMYGDTTSTKGFTWYTDTTIESTDLEVVEKVDGQVNFENSFKFKGENYLSTNSTNPDNSLKKEELVHKAVATGLKEDTTYYFRVGDSSKNIWSKTGSFKTAPKSGEFTFINMADPQAKTEDECKLSAETIEKAFKVVPNAEFLSINGDFVDKGYEEKQWNWLLGYSQDNLLNTTLVPVAGNHEEQTNTFIDHFNLDTPEGSSTETGAYYSYDYSNT